MTIFSILEVARRINGLICRRVAGRRILLPMLRLASFFEILELLTPAMPAWTTAREWWHKRHRIFIVVFSGVFSFCLIGHGILALVTGTFAGSDNHRLYFAADRWNLFLYAFVAPAYMATAACFITRFMSTQSELRGYAVDLRGLRATRVDPRAKPPSLQGRIFQSWRMKPAIRVITAAVCAGLITWVTISGFIGGLRDPRNSKPLYWFFDIGLDGARILNPAGIYYATCNAFLLFITVVTVLGYLSLSCEIFRIGHHIKRTDAYLHDRFESLKKVLSGYSDCYVLAKILVAVYIINILIWRLSPGGRSANEAVAEVALSLIGGYVVSIPPIYLEVKWYQARKRSFADTSGAYQDVRSPWQRNICDVLNIFFIGSFVTQVFSIAPVRFISSSISSFFQSPY